MPVVEVTVPDIQRHLSKVPTERIQAVIDGTLARAAVVAPCIIDAGFTYADAAKDILIDAIVARLRRGAGAPRRVTVDDGSVEYEPGAKPLPASVITDLQDLCGRYTESRAGSEPAFSFPASPMEDRLYRAAVGVVPRAR